LHRVPKHILYIKVVVIFQNIFCLKYVEIILFYFIFLKFIFNISTSKPILKYFKKIYFKKNSFKTLMADKWSQVHT
jgi:hypothetical protein